MAEKNVIQQLRSDLEIDTMICRIIAVENPEVKFIARTITRPHKFTYATIEKAVLIILNKAIASA